MSKSHRSSHASEICRLEWRPSRLLAVALLLLGLLAGIATLASEMPAGAAWMLAVACMLGGGHSAKRSLRSPPRDLVWNGHSGSISMDGAMLTNPRLAWRGPIAVLSWCEKHGRTQRLVWWPDTLPAPRRRELRLAAGEGEAAPAPASMAP